MDASSKAELERCMARMASGDAAFLFTFVRRFERELHRVVRRVLTEMGRYDVLADRDEVQNLVLDAAFVIYERSGGWRPGGAAPWTWAHRAIRSEVARTIGHRTVPGDHDLWDLLGPASLFCERAGDPDHDALSSDDGSRMARDGFDELRALAGRDLRLGLLLSSISAVGSPRDRAVFIEYRLQRSLGDPAPAKDVAAMFGLSPANVRQIDHRVRRRLQELIDSYPVYEPLRGLRWLAA